MMQCARRAAAWFGSVDDVFATTPMTQTDAYPAEVARSRDGRLATFDRGLASAHADVAALVAP
jgi:hypothetical protein